MLSIFFFLSFLPFLSFVIEATMLFTRIRRSRPDKPDASDINYIETCFQDDQKGTHFMDNWSDISVVMEEAPPVTIDVELANTAKVLGTTVPFHDGLRPQDKMEKYILKRQFTLLNPEIESLVKDQVAATSRMTDGDIAECILKGRIVRCIGQRDDIPYHHIESACYYCIYGQEPRIDQMSCIVVQD